MDIALMMHREIRKRIQEYSYEGIHFLDSGNYHYLSKFWLEKVQQPFSVERI